MPLVLEPNQIFKVVLESDKSKPENKRPYFKFRYLSGRDWKKLAKTADGINKAKTGEQAINVIFELLVTGLVGWGNMVDPKTHKKIEFNKDNLDQLVTMKEANELLVKFRNQGIEVEDLKNLGSPSA